MAQQFQLPDGRHLDYRVSGAQDGFPLVWHHGTPSSGVVLDSFSAACEKKGVKVVSISRPGYADSTRVKGRRIVDVVADIKALTQHLGINECVAGGWSGGGPHALACGARLPGCRAVLCIAGGAPFEAEGLDWMEGQGQDNIDEFMAAQKGEEELQEFCKGLRKEMIQADAAGLVQALSSILPDVDKQAILENDQMGQYFVDGTQDGLKHGSDGWVDDDLAFINPWGFELDELKVPVFQYQGSEDKMVPFAQGEWLAKHLPQEKLVNHLQQGQGHVSIFTNHIEKMIDELLSAAKS